MFVCALLLCVAASAFPQDASLYRELGGPDGAFPDDPSTYQEDASDSVAIDDEHFFSEELDLSYRAASTGRNVENIPEAPEPRADEDHSGSQDVSDHGHGSAHLQHGFDQGYGHGIGAFNAFDLPVSGHVGYGYSPRLYSHGYNGYPAYGGYIKGYNRFPAYDGYGRGRFALPRHHHGFNSGFGYRPAVHGYSHLPTSSYGRVGHYSRLGAYGRNY